MQTFDYVIGELVSVQIYTFNISEHRVKS